MSLFKLAYSNFKRSVKNYVALIISLSFSIFTFFNFQNIVFSNAMDVLKEKNSECTTEYINDQVAKHLNLSEEYLLSEDENGLGTAYNYRMRWIRTELKKEGKIINIKRGIWRIA